MSLRKFFRAKISGALFINVENFAKHSEKAIKAGVIDV